MRILQVCPYDLGRPGGVQRHVRDLSRALQGAGHEVTIVDARSAGAMGTLRTHGTAYEVSWASRQALDALAARAPFDVLHVHTPWTPFMPWQVMRRIAPRAAARVATFHDTPPPGIAGRLTRAAFGVLSLVLSRRLEAMIAVSAAPDGHLRARRGCARHRLPPCVDLAPYFRVPREPRSAAPMVLFVGRLEPRKGVLLLIEAFGELRSRHPGATLVVCGEGEERVRAERLAGEGVCFTGAVDDAHKLALLAQADVLCAPSPYGESYGLVIAEAMAAGLPVLAAANEGYRTLLQGEGAAGLVAPGSVPALAEGLSRMIGDPRLRRSLSAWGRRQARSADVNARLGDFLSVYEGALSARFSNGLGSGNHASSSARM